MRKIVTVYDVRRAKYDAETRTAPKVRAAKVWLVLDADGNTVFINQAAEQLFDLSSRSMIGHSFARVFANGGVIDALVEEFDHMTFGSVSPFLARRVKCPILITPTHVGADTPQAMPIPSNTPNI